MDCIGLSRSFKEVFTINNIQKCVTQRSPEEEQKIEEKQKWNKDHLIDSQSQSGHIRTHAEQEAHIKRLEEKLAQINWDNSPSGASPPYYTTSGTKDSSDAKKDQLIFKADKASKF